MKVTRAITAGIIVWILIFATFSLLILIPLTRDNLMLQSIIVGVIMIPSTILGAKFYYKKGAPTHGLYLGLTIIGTALLLDALITVPFVEIPNNGSYVTFFSNPTLWVLVLENVSIVWLYWKTSINLSVIE